MESLFPDSVVVEMEILPFVSRFGSSGNGKLQFSLPYGLSTDEYNGDIYICVIIVTIVFKLSLKSFNTSLSSVKIFSTILLIFKLYKDNIFILDASNPCLHIFNKDLMLQKSVVTRGEGQQVVNPFLSVLTSLVLFLLSHNNNSIFFIHCDSHWVVRNRDFVNEFKF